MKGHLIGLDAKNKKGLIEQALNKRRYTFDLSLWQGSLHELTPNLEVEFEVDNKQIIRIQAKGQNHADRHFALSIQRSFQDCIEDYFGGLGQMLAPYSASLKPNHQSLNFTLMKRFLFTAYNNLFELDSTISNATLNTLKNELVGLDKEFDIFSKKSSHPLPYLYEKIFLNKQSQYLKNKEDIQNTVSIIASLSIQQSNLGQSLQQLQAQLAERKDLTSSNYLHAQNHCKTLKKKYVDLVHYLANQKKRRQELAKATQDFYDKHYEIFIKEYLPIAKKLKEDFTQILDSKAYELDHLLWERAKKSLSIRQFFIEAGIIGTYSSKTFLKYFLQNLDKSKVRKETKALYDLLKYLENSAKKQILILKDNQQEAKKCQQYLLDFDKDLQIACSENPRNFLSISNQSTSHIIIMDWEVSSINILQFMQKYFSLFPQKKDITIFCMMINKALSREQLRLAKESGVKYFIQNNNKEQFIDMMRMIL